MKLNHFICACGHDWYEDAKYGTCDKCGCFFYLNERATVYVAVRNPWKWEPCAPNSNPIEPQNT